MPNARARGIGRAAAVLAAAAGGLALAACGSHGPKLVLKSPSLPTTPPASPGPLPTQPVTAPLTGLPASAAVAGRPAVALAVSGANPRGLSAADVVFEEISSAVRYLAVFQSHPGSNVGPISGILPTDGQLLSVLHPLTGYASGTTFFIKVLDHSRVIDLGYPTHASLYSAGGASATTTTLARAARAPAPPQLFTYRGPQSGTSALATTGQSRASSVTVSYGAWQQKWVYDAHANGWSLTSGGPPVRVANLVIQTVHYKTVFLNRRYNQTTTAPKVLSGGPVTVFSGTAGSTGSGTGGLTASGQWSKRGMRDVTVYFDRGGVPMALQPGQTWVILVPPGTRIRTGQASS